MAKYGRMERRRKNNTVRVRHNKRDYDIGRNWTERKKTKIRAERNAK